MSSDGVAEADQDHDQGDRNMMMVMMTEPVSTDADPGTGTEVLIDTIEVSMEEVVTLGQIDTEEIEIICEPGPGPEIEELTTEGTAAGYRDGDGNVMIVDSMPIHEIEVVDSEPEPAGGVQEEVEQGTSTSGRNQRQGQPSFKLMMGNLANRIIGGKSSPRGTKKGGTGTTHLIVTGKNDVLLPIQSNNKKASLQNLTFTTIDGKTVRLEPLGSGIRIPIGTGTEENATGSGNESRPRGSGKVIMAQDLDQQLLSPIVATATMAQQAVSAAFNASNRATETTDSDPSEESSSKTRSNTVKVEVPGGGSIQMQKFYLQTGLCRVCMLVKEHVSPIFEDVNIDANGMVENSRGSNAAHKFSLIAALKTLLDIEVEYNDGLPDMICMECYDELTNFSAYRKRVALAQTKLSVVLDQVKESQLPTFIPSLGEVDIQKTDIYRHPASIITAKNLLKNSQYAHLALRNISDRTWDKIFGSLLTIVGPKSEKLKSLETYVCDKPYVCGFFCHTCNSTVHGTKEDYAQHYSEFHGIKSSQNVMYPCDICGNSFPLKEATSVFPVYFEHWLQHFFLHDCDICSKKLPSAKGVWVHKKSAHSNKEKLFSCTFENCDKSFARKTTLDEHLRTHLEPNSRKDEQIICSICGKGMSSSSLAVHMNSVHSTERTWTCEICDKQFKRKEILTVHRDTVHMNIKKYKCETCGDSFGSQSAKITHMLRHKDEKQFNCGICSKQFYTSNELKSHTLTHESAIHECDECGKTFKRLSYLSEHKRTHTGEKPNKCPICGKEIRMRSNYFKHLRIHKRKNEMPATK